MKHTSATRKYRLAAIVAGAIILLAAVTWLGIRLLPATASDMRHSTIFVDGHTTLCLITGRDTLVLHSDTLHQQGVWINRHWWWPSCDGRVLTLCPTVHRDTLRQGNYTAVTLAAHYADSIGRLLKRKHTEQQELAYYLRSHGVQDEGYTRIAAYAATQQRTTALLDSTLKVLKAFRVNAHSRVAYIGRYRVSWYDDTQTLITKACRPFTITLRQQRTPIILYAADGKKPWEAYAVRNVPWGISTSKEILVTTIAQHDTTAEARTLLVNGICGANGSHDVPRLLARNGSAVYTRHGRFVGIVNGKKVER
jgi:hypothetical protein